MEKRKDSHNVILKTGECQRKDGRYQYCWTDKKHKRNYVYADTLKELREKEKEVEKDILDGMKIEAKYMLVNDMYERWKTVKRGIRNTTFENYTYMYDTFAKDTIGRKRICDVQKSDIRQYYNNLVDYRGLKASTVDTIQTVLFQVFQMAVDDLYTRVNPCVNALKELKRTAAFSTEKRKALTRDQQDLLLRYLRETPKHMRWYPVFAIFLGTGMRVGELTGLRWCDVNLEEGYINVDHTLVYCQHRNEEYKKGCYYSIHSTKTSSGIRRIPMMDFVKEAFELEREYQITERHDGKSIVIDGYTDFIFINREGGIHNQGTLNSVIKRIIRDCNYAEFDKCDQPKVLLPNFSCHHLRHSFATRMCEQGVNIKVIQDVMGHADISTTMNIYTDVTEGLKKDEFKSFEQSFGPSQAQE